MERNIFMTIEYDGSGFCGWQRQPNVRTVQGHLEEVLSHVCGTPIKINGTSRTDAGVHALGQCASFRGEFGIPTERIMLAANNILAGGRQALKGIGDVRITALCEMPQDFHARFSARGKQYRLSDPQSAGTGYFSQALLLSGPAAAGHRGDAQGCVRTSSARMTLSAFRRQAVRKRKRRSAQSIVWI